MQKLFQEIPTVLEGFKFEDNFLGLTKCVPPIMVQLTSCAMLIESRNTSLAQKPGRGLRFTSGTSLKQVYSLLASLSAIPPYTLHPHHLFFQKARHYTIIRLEGSQQAGRNCIHVSSKFLNFARSFTTREQVYTVLDLKDAFFSISCQD